MKVRGDDASEDADLNIYDTDVKNLGHELRWLDVCKGPKGPQHYDRDKHGE